MPFCLQFANIVVHQRRHIPIGDKKGPTEYGNFTLYWMKQIYSIYFQSTKNSLYPKTNSIWLENGFSPV